MNMTKGITDVLNVINEVEVMETNGGDSPYILIELTDENIQKFNDVGVSSETLNKYGDNETTCLLALAFGEEYADDMTPDGKFVNKKAEFHNYLENIISNVAEEDNDALQDNVKAIKDMYRKELNKDVN